MSSRGIQCHDSSNDCSPGRSKCNQVGFHNSMGPVLCFLFCPIRIAFCSRRHDTRVADGICTDTLGVGVYFYTYAIFALVSGATLDCYGARYPITLGVLSAATGSVMFGLGSLPTRVTPADRPSLKRSPKLFSQITLLPGAEASSNNARSAFSGMRRPGCLRW